MPFCATSCDFCAFYQEKPHRDDLMRYLDGMERELDRWQAECAQNWGGVDPLGKGSASAKSFTIFFGGGTPGLLSTPDMARLCEAVRSRAPWPIEEWTVEMAPSTVKMDKVKAMLDAGVTRISMGVQSFDDQMLENLGRRHASKQVLQAYDVLRNAGCQNINLDLIFAVPGQTREQWTRDMQQAVALQPEHVSTYCLTFEEDTKLWVQLTRGELRRDIQNEAELYRYTWEYLAGAGYAQYEVSNFSRPSYACQHNLGTWYMGAWRGVGPAAASQWLGERWSNPADLNRWLDGLKSSPMIPPLGAEEKVSLSEDLLAADALIFGLRLNDGVDLERLHRRFPKVDWSAYRGLWQDLEAEGSMSRNAELLSLTDSGRMYADAIGGRILEVTL
ncbi:MAG: coproporphyrinogen-III oxidase family protein [Verrucomicrobiota bacterium]